MARLTLHTPQTAPEASRPFVERALAGNGFLPNLIAILANSPQALETYVTVGQINKFLVTVPGIDMKLKIRLHAEAGGDDFPPDARQDPLREGAGMAQQQATQNSGLASRTKGRRKSVRGGSERLFEFRDLTTDFGAPHQQIVQRIVDLIDLTSEILKRFSWFSHKPFSHPKEASMGLPCLCRLLIRRGTQNSKRCECVLYCRTVAGFAGSSGSVSR